MDYIGVSEFKKQSDNVQKILLNWWKENIEQYDIFYRKSKVGFDWSGRQKYIVTKVKGYELETITLRNRKISGGRDAWTVKWDIQCICNIIPLWAESKLRKFIEDKTGLPVKLQPRYINHKIQYQVITFVKHQECYLKENMHSEIYNNPLEAYWEIAIKIVDK